MALRISELEQVVSLDDDDVPFEAPPGRVSPPRLRKRQKKHASLVGFLAIIYALGAVGVGAIDQGGLLFAWLVTGPLLFGIVRTPPAAFARYIPFITLRNPRFIARMHTHPSNTDGQAIDTPAAVIPCNVGAKSPVHAARAQCTG